MHETQKSLRNELEASSTPTSFIVPKDAMEATGGTSNVLTQLRPTSQPNNLSSRYADKKKKKKNMTGEIIGSRRELNTVV